MRLSNLLTVGVVRDIVNELYNRDVDAFVVGTANWCVNDLDKQIPSDVTTCVIVYYDQYSYEYRDVSYSNSKPMHNNCLETICGIANSNKRIRFILATENFGTQRELQLTFGCPNNLCVVESLFFFYLDDTINQYNRVIKTFSEEWHTIALNSKPRPHRVALVKYLGFLGLTSNAVYATLGNSRISGAYSNKSIQDCYNVITDCVYPYSHLRNALQNVNTLGSNVHSSEYEYLKDEVGLDSNVYNFNEKLSSLYENTVVEIISETTGVETAFCLTEKYYHSVLACNFPVLVASFGSVSQLRAFGYDVFDDIVDHSYDYEPNPFYRMKMAIDANIKLITDKEYALSKWQTCSERFERNIQKYLNGRQEVADEAVYGVMKCMDLV